MKIIKYVVFVTVCIVLIVFVFFLESQKKSQQFLNNKNAQKTEKNTKDFASFVALQTNNKETIVVKNNEKKWMLPGGIIDEGETPENTAIRELKEESGLVVQENNLKLIHKKVDENGNIYLYKGKYNEDPKFLRAKFEKRLKHQNPPETNDIGLVTKEGEIFVVRNLKGKQTKSRKFRKGTIEHLKILY